MSASAREPLGSTSALRSCSGLLLAALVLGGCTSTVDSLGHDETDAQPQRPSLRPLDGPDSYPNPFRDVLGRTQAEIDARIAAAFDRLFYGSPDDEAIYFEVGDDRALIRDILHDDVRTEGVGLGMMITVQLDRQEEFDRLWRYAKSNMGATGPNEGYYASFCNNLDGLTSVPCIDPYGMEQFAMSLVFAHGRWGSTGEIDYETDALELLDVLRHGAPNIDGDVTQPFDSETKLLFHEPRLSASSFTRPSIQVPAYLELWARATGDEFFAEAAVAARSYLRTVMHPMTGLIPVRSDLTGMPLPGWDSFRHEAYRAEVSMAIDGIWGLNAAADVAAGDRLLRFFVAQGLETYGQSFALDGGVIDPLRDPALVAANGALAALSALPERTEFVEAVWELEPSTGTARYYRGLLELLSLLVLGGRFQIY